MYVQSYYVRKDKAIKNTMHDEFEAERDAIESAFAAVASSTPLIQTSFTANGSASSSDSLLLADATIATFTLTLPDPSTLALSKTYTVKKTTVTNDVVIASVAGTVEGAATYSILAADGKKAVTFAHDGTNWFAIGSFA